MHKGTRVRQNLEMVLNCDYKIEEAGIKKKKREI